MAAPDSQVPGLPEEVAAIRREISAFLDQRDSTNRKIGNSTFGVYIFYDYDGESIYVGQTKDSLRSRISRHLTNQRTDAVAMSVLDPFEVAEIEVWPLDDLFAGIPVMERPIFLSRAEFTVFQKAIVESRIGVILNEKEVLHRKSSLCLLHSVVESSRKAFIHVANIPLCYLQPTLNKSTTNQMLERQAPGCNSLN